MKKIVKYALLAVAATALLASCNKNEPAVFDDEEAFVAFQKTSFSVAEDGKKLQIPVTLASVAGLSESVKFEITSPETKGAKEGVNFDLLTSSGVLSFDKDHRTQYIEIQPKTDGVYTGDLKFAINLVTSATIKMGDATTCNVTISDIDHPLSLILGDWTFTGTKYGQSSPVSWTCTLFKDAEDDHKVWFYNMMGNSGWAGDDIVYYGNVNDDLTGINVPFGQESEYKYSNGNPVLLLGLDASLDGFDTGSMDLAITVGEDGKVRLSFPSEWGLWFYIPDAGGIGTYLAGTLSAVKN